MLSPTSASEAAARLQVRLANAFALGSMLALLAAWFIHPPSVSNVWRLLVCVGALVLVAARLIARGATPLPKIWLLSLFVFTFPPLYDFYFGHICSTTKLAALDQFLWKVDAAFGYPQPHLTRFLVSLPLLFELCRATWYSLPLFFILAYLALPEHVQTRYLATLFGIGIIIAPMYALCPGGGPKNLFPTYPESLSIALHPHPIFLPAGLQLNATPSGHFTWALVMCWFTYKYCNKWIAFGFVLVALLTIGATLGLGEHYVFDLMLSIPYGVAVWALTGKQWLRGSLLLAVVTAWLCAVRFGWAIQVPPSVVFALSALTVLYSLAPLVQSWKLVPSLNQREALAAPDQVR